LAGRAFIWSDSSQSWLRLRDRQEPAHTSVTTQPPAGGDRGVTPRSDWGFVALGAIAATAALVIGLGVSRAIEYLAQPTPEIRSERLVEALASLTRPEATRDSTTTHQSSAAQANRFGLPQIVPVTSLPLVSHSTTAGRHNRS
jgi:hypothetical protein